MSNTKIYFRKESFDIIGCAMRVHNELGNGFLEAVYQEALEIEFLASEIPFAKEKLIDVHYKGKLLKKKYIADFVCYDHIIIELKATETFCDEHISQVINYLKATKLKLGILINFGSDSLEFKRIVL
jgi:GxxExxY protein